jgi:hypothetical protein
LPNRGRFRDEWLEVFSLEQFGAVGESQPELRFARLLTSDRYFRDEVRSRLCASRFGQIRAYRGRTGNQLSNHDMSGDASELDVLVERAHPDRKLKCAGMDVRIHARLEAHFAPALEPSLPPSRRSAGGAGGEFCNLLHHHRVRFTQRSISVLQTALTKATDDADQ